MSIRSFQSNRNKPLDELGDAADYLRDLLKDKTILGWAVIIKTPNGIECIVEPIDDPYAVGQMLEETTRFASYEH